MESDFFYADLNVHIRLKWDKRSALAGLTDNQLSALRQGLYTMLSCFVYQRALFLTDNTELAKIDKDKIRGSENERVIVKDKPNGGINL